MSERLVRVERFEELRIGVVVLIVCVTCGGKKHRGMILSRPRVGGCTLGRPVWNMTPERCAPCGLLAQACECAVLNGNVYRVEDGYDPAAEKAEEQRKPARPKARAR